jgi:hypothetical protein
MTHTWTEELNVCTTPVESKGHAEKIDSCLNIQAEASRFVELLTGKADTPITWHPVHDRDPERRMSAFHGTVTQCFFKLWQLNLSGWGVFAMVNEGNLRGRTKSDVQRVRALFVDVDKNGAEALAAIQASEIPPHFVVESSPGKYHCYWRVAGCPVEDPDGEKGRVFKASEDALIARFGGDPGCADLARIMRVPGFLHNKGAPVHTRIVSVADDRTPIPYDEFVSRMGLIVQLDKPARTPGSANKPTTTQMTGNPDTDAAVLGGRNNWLTSRAGSYRREGYDADQLAARLRADNARLSQPLPETEVNAIVNSAMKWPTTPRGGC